ncbi:MAG: NADH-dependent flavin oxidoreductase [Candidatus Izemoplasma sp.]|nr:NADH-dependent flavin oxidoreductase [Candidatus Izemoplasma sp.]
MARNLKTYQFQNGITLRNPFVLAPMTTYSSNADLTLSQEEEAYYRARAKSFGMIITAATAVNKNAQAFEHQITIRDDRYIESMTRLANAIKEEGSVGVLQLHHGGRMCQPNLFKNQRIVAPSAVKAEREFAVTPEKLKISEIYDIIDDFKDATKRALQAGFDGVELHGANTYLIQQFFSPHSNRRIDEFGGSVEKRMRFIRLLVDAVLEVKEEADRPFIVGYRFSPEEIEEPGITLNDTLQLVDYLSETHLDYLHISIGHYDKASLRDKTDSTPVVTKIQSVLQNKIPLIGVGGIHSLKDVELANRLGYDLYALGMGALADPDIPNKLINEAPLKNTIDEASVLPKPLKERLKHWGDGLEKRGYKIK